MDPELIICSKAYNFEFNIPAECTYKIDGSLLVSIFSKVENGKLRVEVVSVSTKTLVSVSDWLRVYTLAKQKAKNHFQKLGLL